MQGGMIMPKCIALCLSVFLLLALPQSLPKLSRKDVNKAIKKYLNFSNLCAAVITQDAESLKNDLINNTPAPIKYANPNMPKEVLGEDTVIQIFPLDIKSEKVRIAPAAEFFQKTGLPAK